MMKYERFTWKTEKLQHLDDEVIMVVDNANKDWKGHILNIVDMLNDLNDERMMYKTTIDKRIVELEEENERMRQFITKGKRLSVKELMENTNENELLKKKIRGLEKENDDLRTTITKQVGAITEMKDLLYMFADLRIFDYSSEIEEDMQELKKAYDGTLEDFLKYFKEG